MARFFNTSGPNNPADHYTLPVMTRLPGVRGLIDQKLLATTPYHEIAPHLVLMAFLHRVVNGGSIEREMKVWRPAAADPLASGLVQLDAYLAGLGLDHGWLVIFDRRPDAPPLTERLGASETTTAAGRRVTVIRA